MFAIWWAWRSLRVGERLLLAASLLAISFCAGISWQNYHHHLSAPKLLQESSQAKLIHWNPSASIIVDVSGNVAHPGIVQLPSGARLQDAIKKAGGVLPGTNVSTLNLVAPLSDGEQVQVGEISQKSTYAISTYSGHKSGTTHININQASEMELQSLPHVGPVMAARIVAYRKSHGRFKDFDDLNAVKGIGVKTIEKLRPFIVFH